MTPSLRLTFTITSRRERHVKHYCAISRFIIKSAFIKHWITKLLPKCIFTRHERRLFMKEHRGIEKEERSWYAEQFC